MKASPRGSDPLRWKKKGLLIRPDTRLSWNASHCMVPTPYALGDGLIRVYFSGRDRDNRSRIGFAVVDLATEQVMDMTTDPVLEPGDLGCFDDNGVTPSCVRDIGGLVHLYYIGWNPGSTVRVNLFGGLAISSDGGRTFERWSRAPIIERSRTDPFLNTAPWVVAVGEQYYMYYVSGCGWRHRDLPRYNIKLARSHDGREWSRDGHVCIDFRDQSENALARPYVIVEDGVWKMWFAHRGDTYRIGYAESNDGLTWERIDERGGLDVSADGFDSEMIEYGAVVKHEGRHFMFYNGNNYGFDGIGLAVQE